MLREFPEPLFCRAGDSNSILIFAFRSISVFPGIICTKDWILHTEAEPHSGAINAKSKENMG